MKARWLACHQSARQLPLWVKVWVLGVLVPVNTLPFGFLDTRVGRAAAVASLLVVISNTTILLAQRGITRLMALPHLIAWIPLVSWLAASLLFDATLSGSEADLAIALLIVNGISLGFDTVDYVHWLCGQRGHLGRPTSALDNGSCP